MATMAGFFGARRGIMAIDYAFAVMLAYSVNQLALRYGEIASPVIRRALHIA